MGLKNIEIDYKDIGKRIRTYRKNADMSQQELSQYSSLQINSLSHIENGTTKVSLSSLVKISYGLNIPIEKLLCGVALTSQNTINSVFEDITAGCSQDEIKVLYSICKEAKDSIRKNLLKII